MIGDWIYDHLGWLVVAGLIALVALIWMDVRSMDRECQHMMQLARSPRDSLDARIACNKMQSDAATAFAIGAAAGAIAGSSGRR